jgi:hypothetical protein
MMLRLNPADDEAFMNKLWFQKWVCDWRGWDADMLRLRRVLDAHAAKGCRACLYYYAEDHRWVDILRCMTPFFVDI